MGVTLGCLGLAVAQELPGHVEGLAQAHCDAGEAVPQVMQPNIFKARLLANALPWLLKVDQMSAWLPTGNDMRIIVPPFDGAQKLQRRGI